jgi:hypothetical protein
MVGTAGAPEPLVSILVVSFNTREMTLACLRSVAAETRAAHEIIVVDNASSDGSAAAIAAAFPDVTLLALAENLGFARANNLAATRARGRYLLLLNPDTLVLGGAIDRLLGFAAARPSARIWGGRTLFGDGSLNPTSCFADMTLWSLFCQAAGLSSLFRGSAVFNPEAYGGWARDRERAVDIVTGCFFLIPRDFWAALGGFDPAFVMYGEEVDLCRRARAAGARPLVTPDAVIVHYGGASQAIRADRMVRLLTAKVTLIRRRFGGWRLPLGLALFQAWPVSRWFAAALAGAVSGRARAAARSWAEVVRRRGEWLPGYPPAR